MRILLIASAFNSLTQRVFTELDDRGHRVAVHTAPGARGMREAVRAHRPELVIAPMLTEVIPPEVWSAVPCLVVHPGPPGDRGPSALDRALQDGVTEWGVTVLQAVAGLDAGPVWAAERFPVPPGAGKSDLYRGEVADAALRALRTALGRFTAGERPAPGPPGPLRPLLRQAGRRIDWAADGTGTVLRRLRAADSRPGVRDTLAGAEWYLHGGHREPRLRGRPGELIATRDGAVCRATADGAVWIPRLRPVRRPGERRPVRLPAVRALALAGRLPRGLPEIPAGAGPVPDGRAWSEIHYREEGPAGFLTFAFPGGAMDTGRCRRLLRAWRHAVSRPVRVLVLGPRRDFFSNGIDLDAIEAAADPAAESWSAIRAMNDLVEAVLTTTDRLVVAALPGNAAAGGAMLALAADEVWCRSGSVLNPHYRRMGLYGSEFWTYTLPRRAGRAEAGRLTGRALPVGAARAARLGLVDRVIDAPPEAFAGEAARLAAGLARSGRLQARIAEKKAARERDEAARPLARYREAELLRMRAAFDDPAAPYHALRAAFVRREGADRAPADPLAPPPEPPGGTPAVSLPGRVPEKR
ncbi:enoyl-CoA hydratase-related protein [Streptomyces aidingensis]|uniref:Putative two-component system protein, hydrogenase maturation factor HypX/HoxX n=1 Tax=Streptomyces aidingensis TaxID=910347 RepID=A0A1I1PFR4_9ACTN|nr:enoyl-CoA hydratase-related protein [Streptomyces aidingensis]SFD06488.1 putative two-component system protein, hydrogenase maturation factor HypX/HoxX [Streptomyces aidingensis]